MKEKYYVIDFEVPGFPTKKTGTLFKIQIIVTNKFSFKVSLRAMSSSIVKNLQKTFWTNCLIKENISETFFPFCFLEWRINELKNKNSINKNTYFFHTTSKTSQRNISFFPH